MEEFFYRDNGFGRVMMCQTAAGALHNASLMEAEKKIEILETLVEVSNEITSTLNLDRVLQVVVNGPQRILAYERAAVALETKGKLQLKAVSGIPRRAAGGHAASVPCRPGLDNGSVNEIF